MTRPACIHDVLKTFSESANVHPSRRARADRNAAELRSFLQEIEVVECPETLEAIAAVLIYIPRQLQRMGLEPRPETVACTLDASEAIALLYYNDPEDTADFDGIVSNMGVGA